MPENASLDMQSKAKQIDADSTIADLLDAHPTAAKALLRRGMACVGCTMAPFETLADAAREYRVSLNVLLEELRLDHGSGPHRPRTASVRRKSRLPPRRQQSPRYLSEPGEFGADTHKPFE